MRGSWSYSSGANISTPWESSPEERFEEASGAHCWTEDFRAAARGDFSEAENADLADAGKAAFFVVNGLKWNNGNDDAKARETMKWLAQQHPINERGNERVWMQEKYTDFIARLFSEETDARQPRRDPLPPRARRRVDRQKEVREDAINRAFWDLWAGQGYATVQDVHAEIDQDITVERTRQVLDGFVEGGNLDKIDHPDPDDARGNPQAYIPDGEEPEVEEENEGELVTDGGQERPRLERDDRVRDTETGARAVVANPACGRADEYEVREGTTVADLHQQYPPDEQVVEIVKAGLITLEPDEGAGYLLTEWNKSVDAVPQSRLVLARRPREAEHTRRMTTPSYTRAIEINRSRCEYQNMTDEEWDLPYESYDEYSFNTEQDPDLMETVEKYEHIFNMENPLRDIMGAWILEKPVSCIEVMNPEEAQRQIFPSDMETIEAGDPEEIGAFLHEIGQWFHYYFDGYNLYISRFGSLPGIIAGLRSSAAHGLLYGYPIEDVAQATVESEHGASFKTEREWG